MGFDLLVCVGAMLLWFFYGTFYADLRDYAIRTAIYSYNGTNRPRPLLIWLFFPIEASNHSNINCYYRNYSCVSCACEYAAGWHKREVQPNSWIAFCALPLTLYSGLCMALLVGKKAYAYIFEATVKFTT